MNEIDKQIYKAVSDVIKVLGIAKQRAFGQNITDMRIAVRENEGYTFPEVWGKLDGRFVRMSLGQAKEGGIYARDDDRWIMYDKDARQEWALEQNGWVKHEQQAPAPAPTTQPVGPGPAFPASEPMSEYTTTPPDDELPF